MPNAVLKGSAVHPWIQGDEIVLEVQELSQMGRCFEKTEFLAAFPPCHHVCSPDDDDDDDDDEEEEEEEDNFLPLRTPLIHRFSGRNVQDFCPFPNDVVSTAPTTFWNQNAP